MFLIVLGRGNLDRDVGGLESGDLVLVRILGIGSFVRGTVDEMQVQSVGPLADEHAFARQADAGRGGVRQIGEEDAFPQRSAGHGLDVLHVKNDLGEAFVKHARLDFERGLGRFQVALELSQSFERAGREIDAVAESEQPGQHHENRNHAQEGPHPQAAGAHGGDFAVRGQTAESDEDADQHAHGNGVGKRDRHGKEKDFGYARQRSAVADHEFEDASEIAGEKDKSENRRADQGVGDDFSQDVAGEDAHPQGWLT